jgi:hypothetical protein
METSSLLTIVWLSRNAPSSTIPSNVPLHTILTLCVLHHSTNCLYSIAYDEPNHGFSLKKLPIPRSFESRLIPSEKYAYAITTSATLSTTIIAITIEIVSHL